MDLAAHYRLTNYYDDKLLECDGRTADHPVNKDVNSPYVLFSDAEMALKCRCATLPGCLEVVAATEPANALELKISPNPASTWLNITSNDGEPVAEVKLYSAVGTLVQTVNGPIRQIDVSALPEGIYLVRAQSLNGQRTGSKVIVARI